MSIEEDLLQYITAEMTLDTERGPLTAESSLIASGRVDSLGLLRILGYVQQRYGVDLLAAGSPRDFESAAGMAAAIRRLRGDA